RRRGGGVRGGRYRPRHPHGVERRGDRGRPRDHRSRGPLAGLGPETPPLGARGRQPRGRRVDRPRVGAPGRPEDPGHGRRTMKRRIDARTGLEIIDPDECRRLLATEDVGRLAIVDGSTPLVFPVNYALDGDAVVFRTVPGTKLALGPRGAVSFEVDAIDRTARTGWSVLVVGHLEEVEPFDA